MHHKRTQLANEMIYSLSGEDILSDTSHGLFLAAPRRTGKSAFVVNDLKPGLEKDHVVIYVDLWKDKSKDPSEVIQDEIKYIFEQNANFLVKSASSLGVQSIGLSGFSVDITKMGQKNGPSIHDALRFLHEKTKKPIAIIIDEAQHALTTEAGENAMFALKSARDQMRPMDVPQLKIIMTGSDRDKLLRLMNTHSSPFFGSSVTTLPHLGLDFIHAISVSIKKRFPDEEVSEKDLQKSFELFRYRPQIMLEEVKRAVETKKHIISEGNIPPVDSLSEIIIKKATAYHAQEVSNIDSDFFLLSSVAKSVVCYLLEDEKPVKMFDAKALKYYSDKTGEIVTAQKAQAAISSLREMDPPFIWKSIRGEYAVADSVIYEWKTSLLGKNAWPPSCTGKKKTSFKK